MRLAFSFLLMYFLAGTSCALAAAPEAREVARINNCSPKKIEVFQQTLGNEGKTIYRVECNLPKSKDEETVQTADALLVQCKGSLCALLRPVEKER